MPLLKIHASKRFKRQSDIVRCHFLDMHHHLATGVHAGIRYTILTEEPGRMRLCQDFRVMGMAKHDELVLYATPDGRVIQEFLAGDFAGGGIELRFFPDFDGTWTQVTLTAPLRGLNRLLAPMIRRTVARLTDQALEEDRRDLEDANYQPGTWAKSALAVSRKAA